MGAPMARRLLKCPGHRCAFTIDHLKKRAESLIADGADVAANPVKAAKDAEVVFYPLVPDTPDAEKCRGENRGGGERRPTP